MAAFASRVGLLAVVRTEAAPPLEAPKEEVQLSEVQCVVVVPASQAARILGADQAARN